MGTSDVFTEGQEYTAVTLFDPIGGIFPAFGDFRWSRDNQVLPIDPAIVVTGAGVSSSYPRASQRVACDQSSPINKEQLAHSSQGCYLAKEMLS
jgi:hypothetical protein